MSDAPDSKRDVLEYVLGATDGPLRIANLRDVSGIPVTWGRALRRKRGYRR